MSASQTLKPSRFSWSRSSYGRRCVPLVVAACLWVPVSVTASDNAGIIPIKEDLMVGLWGNSDDGGTTFWGFDEYRTDGTFRSWGNLPDGMGYKVSGIYQVLYEAGQKKVCIQFLTVNEPLQPLQGEIYCNELLSVNGSAMVFKDEQSGALNTLYRRAKSTD